ncbi:MAG: sulfite exporter TauE/SafE family protein [Thiobacillaceae bacterium]
MGHSLPLVRFILSFSANWFSAFSGGGAGPIQLPMRIFVGMPFGIVLGTPKVASVALGLGPTLLCLKDGGLAARETFIILGAGLPTRCCAGASWTMTYQILIGLGLLTLGVGLYSAFRPQQGFDHVPRNWKGIGLYTGVAGLFGIGFFNGAITSGTGLFLSVWLIRHFGMDSGRALGNTMRLCGLFWNGTGVLGLGYLGTIAWQWMPALLAGSILGGYAGSHTAIKKKGNVWTKRSFEILTLLIGLTLVFS